MPLSDSQTLYLAIATGVVLVALIFALWLRRRRRQREPDARLRAVAEDLLANFLLPDGDDGEIHIEFAALTADGVLVVDIKRVSGHVFGSDAMQDWTVIGERRRFTFANPQPALYDRIAAVRRLLPDVPVDGYVVFTPGADFSKGLPAQTLLLDELIERLAGRRREAGSAPENYRAGWDQLRHEAVAAQLGQLMKQG
jgi:hypothetical protein